MKKYTALNTKIRIGDLDRQITLRALTTSRDTFGEEIQTWSDLATVWAKVDYSTGFERFEGEQETAFTGVVFYIRHRTDLNQKLRIVYENEEYDIKGIHEVDRRFFLKIIAELRE